MMDELEYKATGTVKGNASSACMPEKRRPTSAKPFNITKPRPRLIPEPEVISREVKALPVPASHHATSLADVEEQKKQRLEEQKAKVASKYNSDHEFNLETGHRREGTEKEELAKKVDAERMAECTFKPKIVKFQPPSEEAVV